jgi:hypothetical protein
MDEKFTLIVEGKMSHDITAIAPHDLELNGLTWHNDSPPDIVVMHDLILVKVGKYTSHENRYQYRIADVAHLIGGRLEAVR